MKGALPLGVPTLLLKDTPLLRPPPFCINTTCRFAWASLRGNTCNLEGLETLQEYEAVKTRALVFHSQMEVLVGEFLPNATLERRQKRPPQYSNTLVSVVMFPSAPKVSLPPYFFWF